MELRDLSELRNLNVSQEFLIKNKLKSHLFRDGDIVFYNNCFILHIYAFYIEDIPYIDIYKIDDEKAVGINIDYLINKLNLGSETVSIYKTIKEEYTLPITWDKLSNKNNCLKTEQNYITYLSVLNKYTPSIFDCENVFNYSTIFENMNNEYERKYKNLMIKLQYDIG
jgi:hypothetical protein